MIALNQVSSGLHTYMYFFLTHLSFVDFCNSVIIVPKMLSNILNKEKSVSFLGCMVQFYLLCMCTVTEVFLLTVMACDCFLPICSSLLYMLSMSQKFCMVLVSSFYICGTVCSLVYLCLALEIPSCRSNVVTTSFVIYPLSYSCLLCHVHY